MRYLGYALAWFMLPAVALAGGSLRLGERELAVIVVLTPRGAAPSARTAEIVRAASEALAERTNLALRSVEQAGSDLAQLVACADREQLSCWVRVVRRDYDRAALLGPDGAPLDYERHLSALQQRGVQHARFLLAVSVFPREGAQDRLAATLIDTDAALRLIHEAPRGAESGVENEIFAGSIRTPPVVVDTAAAGALLGYFEALFDGPMRPTFERTEHWAAFATVEIESVEGLLIELDGRAIGQTAAGRTRLEELRFGNRALVLTHPGGRFEPYSTVLRLSRGVEPTIAPTFVARPTDAARTVRVATLWSGLAIAAAGAGLALYAVAASPELDEVRSCAGGGCGGVRFLGFCELSASKVQDCDPLSRGALVAPLGYSLALAGGGAALGAGFVGDDDSVPWIGIAGGLVLGGLAYGLSVALEGGAPP